MSTPCDEKADCPGCEQEVEPERYNQPGLPAISYRLGTHGEFFRRMLDELHTKELLRQQLTTRSRDDLAIALLDAWALVGDVLAFYQERIANEGFLRTATERRSILEIARTIGYELNPGVAASAYLAFMVDDTDANYAEAMISRGTQAQSIPAQGKLPQTFETSEDFKAHVEWNELKPRLHYHQTLGIDDEDNLVLLCPLYDKGGKSTPKYSDYFLINPHPLLEPDDYVQPDPESKIHLSGVATNLKAGELLLLVGKKTDNGPLKAIARKIVSVETDNELNRTVVEIEARAGNDSGWISIGLAGRKKLLGYAAEKIKRLTASTAAAGKAFSGDSIRMNILRSEISEEMLQAHMAMNRWNARELLEHVAAMRTAPTPLSDDRGIFALREHLGFFGNNAPAWESSPVGLRKMRVYEVPWDGDDGWEIWRSYPDDKYYSERYVADVFLERKVEGIGKNSWVVIDPGLALKYLVYRVDDTVDQSITGFSLSGKATGLKLKDCDDTDTDEVKKDGGFKVRTTTIHVKSEVLELNDLPIEENLEEEYIDTDGKTKKSGISYLELDTIVLGLKNGQPVIVNGERTDPAKTIGHEVAVLKDVDHSRGYTVISFKDALQYGYVADTVTVNANVVPATHGETVNEVLGSGDGTKANQRFVLKKPPLTYVAAATPSGAECTLKVKVGVVRWGQEVKEQGIEWERVTSLYNIGPGRQGYTVRLDDNGDVNITFGDGKQGTRLPSGQENIVATYRSGIGTDGEVAADSIKLLKTRPLGIRGVTNPIASSGSQEPETRDGARSNAPRTVLTMDRIVSIQDYEDFARAYAGMGKARAVALWNGETELVHITVAGSNGDPIDANSETYKNLGKSIDACRDNLAMVKIDTFNKRLFQVEAKLLVDEKYTAEDVLSEAKSAFKQAFSFENRDFGQPVTASEVISILQHVRGVNAVDLDRLFLTDRAFVNDKELGPMQDQPAAVLPCSGAEWPEGGDFQKAQILLINTAGIKVGEKEK